MAIYPQLGGKKIITQLPYSTSHAYAAVGRDMETGMRWTYPRRGVAASPQIFSLNPLARFDVSYVRLSDADLGTLETFFNARRGRCGAFEFIDPGGNLLQYSEDFGNAAWDKGSSLSVTGTVTDPFGQNGARSIQALTSNGLMMAVAGPAGGGLDTWVLCASVWVNLRDAGNLSMHIGFVDSGFAQIDGTTFTNLPLETWVRISHTTTFWNNNYVRIIIGGYSTWPASVVNYIYGAQVVAMPGEGAYAKTPGNYGYHQYCRFDVDRLEVRCVGPDQNAVSVPILEYNG